MLDSVSFVDLAGMVKWCGCFLDYLLLQYEGGRVRYTGTKKNAVSERLNFDWGGLFNLVVGSAGFIDELP
jgi:hypothetical protein